MDNLKIDNLQFGDHERQRISVWTTEKTLGYWVIYIHGGAWRDPTISDKSFQPTIAALSSPIYASTVGKVAAFASIDYRLSPHPNFPQDSSTASSQLNKAKHPDHIEDVRSALVHLQKKYGFGSNYLLIGHSCGATLALQTFMDPEVLGITRIKADESLQLPKAVVGVCGIYDMRAMVDNHSTISAYRDFVTDAFGQEEGWDAASPARYEMISEGSLVVLVSSTGDDLIEEAQIELMEERLQEWEKDSLTCTRVLKGELEGTHDEVWEKGVEMAKVVSLINL